MGYIYKQKYDKDIVTVSCVNFRIKYGDKEDNLKRICEYIEQCAKRGSDIIVLPETALCGYENERNITDRSQKTQVRLAEPLPGPASDAVGAVTKKYGVYAVFGMTHLLDGQVYNSICACGPEGYIGVYHKIHLPKEEVFWAVRGNEPLLLDTPWGPVGVGVCYDSYFFPELLRYYGAKGARLYLNPTIVAIEEVPGDMCRVNLEARAVADQMFIASAGVAGLGLYNHGSGGSSIIGPSTHLSDIHYYAGKPFHADKGDEEEVVTATIDLGICNCSDWNMFAINEETNDMDFRPKLYIDWYQEIVDENGL